MRHLSSLVSSSAFAAAVAFFSSTAAAHIHLIEPAPRYAEANKSCPCGDGDSNRTCMDTAEESTDPNRSTNVQTFEAGSTITVVVEEYIDHAGRMRVAFDPDGADLADFNDNILMDVADPSDSTITQADPLEWEIQVPLPNMTCENCTLQIIQAMHGDTANPVMDPAPLSTYYTCADIRLVAAGTLEPGGGGGSANAGEAGGPSGGGSAGAPPAGGSGGAATGGSGGAAAGGSGTGGNGTGGNGTGGSSTGGSSAAGSGSVDDADEEDDSGCAFRTGTGSALAGWSLALLGLAAAARRRRSR
jgi:MYXO-CTERM domain-containing protein